MENTNTTWKIFSMYMLVILLMLFAGNAFGQIKVIQFNAGWNKANDVDWFGKLTECKTKGYTDIAKSTLNKYSRAYNDIVNAGVSGLENNHLELILGKVTYGDYALRSKAIGDKMDEALAARDQKVMAQRAAAFSTYLYNQQLINAVNQPKTITPFSCRKVGHTYHCF